MRYMIIVKANADSEAGVMPSSDSFAAMEKFNEELIKAGVLLAAEGLQASSNGFRIKNTGGKRVITDGPFTESKELIAGFWIVDVKDRDEVVAWMQKVPLDEGEEMEVRKVGEASDIPVELVGEEAIRKEQEWRAEHQKPITR